MSAIGQFVAEIRRDPALAPHADAFETAIQVIDLEGDGSTDAVTLFEAAHWIITQSCSLDARIRALHQLFGLPRGPTKVNLRRRGDGIVVERIE